MSPAKKLGQMFSLAGLAPFAKSLVPFSVLLYSASLSWCAIGSCSSPPGRCWAALGAGLHALWNLLESTLVLLLWAGIDYLLQRQKAGARPAHEPSRICATNTRRATGNPTVKARLRRLQRQMRRRRMLKDVERATVVVTNPTHFAVALEYRPEMAAPVVIAKGAEPAGAADQGSCALARAFHHRKSAAGAGALSQRRGRPGHSRQAICRRGRDSGLRLSRPNAGAARPGESLPDGRTRRKAASTG